MGKFCEADSLVTINKETLMEKVEQSITKKYPTNKMHLQLQNKLKLTNKIINTQQNKYI
jgi:hypothetical protein